MSLPTVAVDLDGLIASWNHGTFDAIGPIIHGAADFLWKLAERAHIVIYTCRTTEMLYPPRTREALAADIRQWLEENACPPCEIWVGQGKPLAVAYVDDRAVSCRPEEDELAYARAECEIMALIEKYHGPVQLL